MPHTTARSATTPAASSPLPQTDRPVTAIRVDGEHPSRRRAGESSAERDLPDVSELDRNQLAQLAQRLRARHEALCRQQEELNAALAEFDQERRKERMRLQEERVRLEELEAEQHARQQQLSLQADRLEERVASLTQKEREVETARRAIEDDRTRHSRQWEQTQSQLEARIAELERQLAHERAERKKEQSLWQSTREQSDSEQRERLQRLGAVERTLKEQTDELEQEKSRFGQRCREWEERLERRRRTWIERWSDQRKRINQWRSRLRMQAESLEARQLAVERMESDLHELHADVLKQRLALETAWERTREHLPSAEHSKLIATLRAQLDDEWHWNVRQQQSQREELEQLLHRVESRAVELAERRQALMQWFRRREEELAARAGAVSRQQRDMERRCDELLAEVEAAESRCHRAEAQLRTWVSREYDID